MFLYFIYGHCVLVGLMYFIMRPKYPKDWRPLIGCVMAFIPGMNVILAAVVLIEMYKILSQP